jgi:hypothetical protein
MTAAGPSPGRDGGPFPFEGITSTSTSTTTGARPRAGATTGQEANDR